MPSIMKRKILHKAMLPVEWSGKPLTLGDVLFFLENVI